MLETSNSKNSKQTKEQTTTTTTITTTNKQKKKKTTTKQTIKKNAKSNYKKGKCKHWWNTNLRDTKNISSRSTVKLTRSWNLKIAKENKDKLHEIKRDQRLTHICYQKILLSKYYSSTQLTSGIFIQTIH